MTAWDRIKGENHRKRCEKRQHETGLAQGQLDCGLGEGPMRQDETRDNSEPEKHDFHDEAEGCGNRSDKAVKRCNEALNASSLQYLCQFQTLHRFNFLP
jgi:hypothetical protein